MKIFTWKKLLLIFFLFCVAVVAATTIFLYTYDFNKFKPVIASAVKGATGRDMVIAGDIEFVPGMVPGLAAGDIRFQNAAWGSRPQMVHIRRFEVEVALLSLLRGVIEIERIILEQPDILIEKDLSGSSNLPIKPSDSPSDEKAGLSMPPVIVHKLEVVDGRLHYTDARRARSYRLQVDRLVIRSTQDGQTSDFDLRGSLQDQPIEITGATGRIYPAIAAGNPLSMSLVLRAAGAKAAVAVNVEDMAQLTGLNVSLNASGPSMAAVAGLADLVLTPDPGMFRIQAQITGSVEKMHLSTLEIEAGHEGLLKVEISGQMDDLIAVKGADLQFTARSKDAARLTTIFDPSLAWKGELSLSGRFTIPADGILKVEVVNFTLADSDLDGVAEVDLSGEKPLITTTVQSRRIDLGPLFNRKTSGSSPKQAAGQSAVVRSQNVISTGTQSPDSVLSAFDAVLTMQTGRIDFPKLTLRDLNTRARLENGRLSVDISGPALPDIKRLSGVSHLQQLGHFTLAGEVGVSTQKVSVDRIKLDAGTMRTAEVQVTGAIDDIAKGGGFDLDIQIRGDDAQHLGHYLGHPWMLNGPYTISGRMAGPKQRMLRFSDIQGRLQDIGFSGALNVNWSGRQILIESTLSTPQFNLRPFNLPWFDIPNAIRNIADLGPLNVALSIKDPAGRYGIGRIDLAAGRKDLLQIEIAGSVDDLGALDGIDLGLAFRGTEIANLEELIGTSLPVQGAFAATATLKTPVKEKFRFDSFKLTLLDNRITGNIEYDAGRKRPLISASLRSDRFDLSALLQPDAKADKPKVDMKDRPTDKGFSFPEWPAPPAFIVDSDIRIQASAGVLMLPRFVINELTSAIDYSGRDFTITAKSLSVSGIEAGQQIPYVSDIKGLELFVRGAVTGDRLTVDTFKFYAGSEDVLMAELEGSAADVTSRQGIDFRLMLRGKDSAYLWKILKQDITVEGPFSISGRIFDPRERNYDFSELSLVIGDSDLSGQLKIDLTGQRPRVEGRLSANHLDLRPYLKTTAEGNLPETPTAVTTTGRSKKVFSSELFDLSALESGDLNFNFEAGTLMLPRWSAQALTIGVLLQDGDLTVSPLKFNSGGGSAEGHVSLKSEESQHTVSAVLKIDDQDVGRMLDRLNLDRDIEGILNVIINFNAPAESVAAFMGGLDGVMVASMSQGRLNNKFIRIYSANIETALMQLASPFTQRDDSLEVNCLVNSFEIQNGSATYAGLLDTPQTTLVAAGKIDLKRERLDVTLKSNPKSGIKVGKLGRFGFSLNELTKPFKLSGTLAHPSLAVDATQTAITFGKLLGGIALGPVGIAAVFADISLGDADPCAKALEAVDKVVK